jgi:hypothetical protein
MNTQPTRQMRPGVVQPNKSFAQVVKNADNKQTLPPVINSPSSSTQHNMKQLVAAFGETANNKSVVQGKNTNLIDSKPLQTLSMRSNVSVTTAAVQSSTSASANKPRDDSQPKHPPTIASTAATLVSAAPPTVLAEIPAMSSSSSGSITTTTTQPIKRATGKKAERRLAKKLALGIIKAPESQSTGSTSTVVSSATMSTIANTSLVAASASTTSSSLMLTKAPKTWVRIQIGQDPNTLFLIDPHVINVINVFLKMQPLQKTSPLLPAIRQTVSATPLSTIPSTDPSQPLLNSTPKSSSARETNIPPSSSRMMPDHPWATKTRPSRWVNSRLRKGSQLLGRSYRSLVDKNGRIKKIIEKTKS